jgi:hypothetical protein
MSIERFKRGDIVKVWSLQSFHGGGFLDGEKAIVRQDQTGSSVLLIVRRNLNLNGLFEKNHHLDTSYEVYGKQVELVQKATLERREMVESFLKINQEIRTREQQQRMKKGDDKITPYHYAPEFYIDDDMIIQIDKDLLEFPELFI